MPSRHDTSPYAVLGVAPNASRSEARQAYLEAVRRNHPDRFAGADPGQRRHAELRMRQLNQAWGIVGDPERRAAYDASTARDAPPRWRPDGNAHPDFVPMDSADDEDRVGLSEEAYGDAVPLARWVQLTPPLLFVAAVAMTIVGFVVALDPVVVLGLLIGVVALVGFGVAPLVALRIGSRRDG